MIFAILLSLSLFAYQSSAQQSVQGSASSLGQTPPPQPQSSQNANTNPVGTPTPPINAPAVPIYRVPSDYSYFTAEKRPLPPYPPEAFKNKHNGDVILAVQYSTDGSVIGATRILGDPELLPGVIQTVSTWKFLPLKQKGEKIQGVTYVGFHFLSARPTVVSAFPFGVWAVRAESADTARDLPPESKRVLVSSGFSAGHRISGNNPQYPTGAKQDRVQGTVILRGIIDKQGHISWLEVDQSPRADLSLAAIEAVKTWEYTPYLLRGEAVEVETTIQINFNLN